MKDIINKLVLNKYVNIEKEHLLSIDSKIITIAGGRGTGKSTVLKSLGTDIDKVYLNFSACGTVMNMSEKFYTHLYEIEIAIKLIELYPELDPDKKLSKQFRTLINEVDFYIEESIFGDEYEIKKYLNTFDITGDLIKRIKEIHNLDNLTFLIDHFDLINASNGLDQKVLRKYFEGFDKVILVFNKISKEDLEVYGYNVVTLEYSKDIKFVDELVDKYVELHNKLIKTSTRYRDYDNLIVPRIDMNIKKMLVTGTNGNISLMIKYLILLINMLNFDIHTNIEEYLLILMYEEYDNRNQVDKKLKKEM